MRAFTPAWIRLLMAFEIRLLPEGVYEVADAAFEAWADRCGNTTPGRDELEAALLAAVPRIRADEQRQILHRAFACQDCGEIHGKVAAPVTPTWLGGYTTVAADGHPARVMFGDEWRGMLTRLITGGKTDKEAENDRTSQLYL